MEAFGLEGRVERDRVLGDALDAISVPSSSSTRSMRTMRRARSRPSILPCRNLKCR
jgi:hypothetical protein